MRLIDAEGIEKFASHYTEFDGVPLTEREKDLVENVCKKISTQMPTAYDLGGVLRRLEEEKYKQWMAYDGGEGWEAYKTAIEIVKEGSRHEQSQTDSL